MSTSAAGGGQAISLHCFTRNTGTSIGPVFSILLLFVIAFTFQYNIYQHNSCSFFHNIQFAGIIKYSFNCQCAVCKTSETLDCLWPPLAFLNPTMRPTPKIFNFIAPDYGVLATLLSPKASSKVFILKLKYM